MLVRGKMDRKERAKQFMPFAALRGYDAALRAKEKVIADRAVLSEEMKEELDRKLTQIHKNDIITVVYYQRGEYLMLTGMVSRVDKDARLVRIVNTKISFEDIYDIRLTEC